MKAKMEWKFYEFIDTNLGIDSLKDEAGGEGIEI